MRSLFVALMAFALVGAAFAQDAQQAPMNPFSFQGGIDLGTDALPTGAAGATESWTRLGFQPDIAFGKFGVGIDLTFRFQMYPQSSSSNEAVVIFPGDWDPNYSSTKWQKRGLLDIYLPKIMYVRYGLKGEDPLYVKLGSIDDLTLGNGFIVGNYSNTKFLPDTRIFGLDLGIDGALFNFPMVGFEALTGNLAQLDVVGGRVFVRPLIVTEIPILKNMQVGLTVAMDNEPGLYDPSLASPKPVVAYGADVLVPLLTSELFPLAAFADFAVDPNNSTGEMVGFGGRLIKIFTYGAQLRLLGAGFIPTYFDANYDIYRSAKFNFMQQPITGDPFVGWLASLGTSLVKDKIVFNASLDGPFKAIPTTATGVQTDYPHARAIFHFGEGIVGGFFFDAIYEKYYLGAVNGFFQDLVDPTDAVVGLAINYRTGASVITMQYDAKWNPTTSSFDVRSSLSASVKF